MVHRAIRPAHLRKHGPLAAVAAALLAAGTGAFTAAGASWAAEGSAAPGEPAPAADRPAMAPPPGEWIPVDDPVEATPSHEDPPFAEHREFQANCSVSHVADDDPIVFPGLPGDSHTHTFMGNTSTDAFSTVESLKQGGETSCKVPGDLSAYWMPTMFNAGEEVRPVGDQVIYYKSGVLDYRSVRPFPTGLRFVVGSPAQTAEEFLEATVQGWECGDSYDNANIPDHCAEGSQLNVRFQAPSCWDGRHLDSPDHRSHMAYPIVVDNKDVCPESHPVAVPMIEFKMAFPADGDTSQVDLASGEGYTFHYDFFNAWDEPVLAALVEHCINGGLQCDARGYDQYHPDEGAALNEDYELP